MTRRERRAELEAQIAVRTQRIADDTAALHDLLRQMGALDAAERLAASILEDGPLEGFWTRGQSVEPKESCRVIPERGNGSSSISTPHESAVDEYIPKLIDRARFEEFCVGQLDYKRRALLEMIRMLEESHPSVVKATDINKRIIFDLKLCRKATFSKLKTDFANEDLALYDGSNKTWSIPT